MSKKDAMHEEFARRFLAACESNPNVPELNKGRLVWFRNQFEDRFNISVTDETIRKWGVGMSRPHPYSKMEALAEILRVDVAWLATGQSNGVTKKQAEPPQPKYVSQDDPSLTWSGRGRHPQWVAEALAAGMSLDDLRIDKPAAPVEEAPKVRAKRSVKEEEVQSEPA